MPTEAASRYPLSWPAGWARTPAHARKNSPFLNNGYAIGVGAATDRLQVELERLRARDPILSTNLALRLDGLPRADQGNPADPGVAVYFTLKGQARCLACDRYHTVAGNIAALAAHIESLRRIDRHGVGTIDQAFAGYTALPPARTWRDVLKFEPHVVVTLDDLEARYRRLAKDAHPDAGGTHGDMAALNAARDQARTELLSAR